MKRLFACAALLLSAVSAHAGIISADFRTEGDLPDYGSVGAKVYQRLDASIGAGYELNGSDFLSNDSGWEGGEVWVDLDPLTKVLRLVAKDHLDFETFRFSLSRLSGMSITGISVLSDTLTDTGVAPLLDFSSDALTITYDVMPGSFHFNGSASFQLLAIDTSTPVPEPESLALFGLGAAMLGLASRRRFSGPAKRG